MELEIASTPMHAARTTLDSDVTHTDVATLLTNIQATVVIFSVANIKSIWYLYTTYIFPYMLNLFNMT